jgi:hypothetical protein
MLANGDTPQSVGPLACAGHALARQRGRPAKVQDGADGLQRVRRNVVKCNAAWLVAIALSLVAACATAAPTPTPTPEPTPTPGWVLATKPEHLAGLWSTWYVHSRWYHRFEKDGTTCSKTEEFEQCPEHASRFWFEDGVYYEEDRGCDPIGSYRVYLQIEGGRALRLRFEEIDDSDPSCLERREIRSTAYSRVDRW